MVEKYRLIGLDFLPFSATYFTIPLLNPKTYILPETNFLNYQPMPFHSTNKTAITLADTKPIAILK
jgi:hypothetical protein